MTEKMKRMLFERLALLQDDDFVSENPYYAVTLKIELRLLYDLLGEEIPEDYWEQIEAVI